MNENNARKIMVVDDDPGIRMTVQASLKRHGFQVFEASGGEQALEMFELDPPDLVLLDIVMPGMSGFDTCEQIRSRFGHLFTPVIMLTGLEDTEAVRNAYQVGASDFVTKPINYQLMNYRVEYVLKASDTALDLRRSRVRQNHAQRIANLGHVEWGADSRISYCSEGMAQILGMAQTESLRTVDELFAKLGLEEQSSASMTLEHTVASRGQHYSLEHRLGKSGKGARHIVQNAELSYDPRNGLDRVTATFQDVTRLRMAEERIHQLAHFDPLTGLPKRRLLVSFLENEIEQARRYDRNVAVVVVGIDGLSRYRDALGHEVAEKLVQQFSERLKVYCRASDYISTEAKPIVGAAPSGFDGGRSGRLGSDEFVITLSEVPRPEDSRLLVRRIRDSLCSKFDIDGQELVITTCMGISVFPPDAQTAEELVRAAEVALSVAREQGQDTQQYYTESLNQRVLNKFSLENELRKALEANELRIHYQPQQALGDGGICGMEALARWPHRSRGFIAPLEFIGIAEEAGLIDALGDWVLATVCNDLQALRDANLPQPKTAINLSTIQFRRVDLVHRMREIMDASGIDGDQIEVEMTESVLISDIERSIAMLNDFRDLGCTIAIDDFGTGYSSLSYLKRIPAQYLKIDRSFVRDLGANRQDQAIVRGIVQLGHSLSMEIIAEGVETQAQKSFLAGIDCDVIQGYLLSCPRPLVELKTWLDTHGRNPQQESLLA